MIQRHNFNSEWWGEEVGIVTDRAFFKLAAGDRTPALRKFAWVEFVQPVSQLPSRQVLAQAGFFQIDTQIRFRLDMRNVELSQCAQELRVESAAEALFQVQPADLRPFQHERFYAVPGATESKLSQRYSLWSASLIRDYPATCLRSVRNNDVQGWFLAQQEKDGLKLTLAMLSARASISGYDLYARSISHFAAMGFRLGFASFSARNYSVLNIYSQLGARFLEPRECWLWVRTD